MTSKPFIAEIGQIVGRKNVLVEPAKMERYCKGFRSGKGEAEAVVRPGTLLELWKVLEACVAAGEL